MKTKNRFILITVILIFVIMVFTSAKPIFAQDEVESIKSRMDVALFQNNTSIIINTDLIYRLNRQSIPIVNAEISYYYESDTGEVFLQTTNTDDNGFCTMQIDKQKMPYKDDEGFFTIISRYNGDDKFSASEEEFVGKELTVSISFAEVDSVKTIVFSAEEITNPDLKTAANEIDVNFYVPRLINAINVGTGYLEEGNTTIAFPVTLPGDSAGNMEVIAKIEEDEYYGTAEISASINWGKVKPWLVGDDRRGLGDTDAPLWMVYTLITLLSVVWFHYMYIVFVLFVIKKDGKNCQE